MKDRILYLDILRALAVLVMVQGHTVDTFLADAYRTYESAAYMTWSVIRGFTAPVFMFTSGLVFTYLLFLGEKGGANPRLKKGLKRFVLLLGLGYLLRYPTYRIYDLWNVTEGQWKIFTAVDTLHLIAFGLLFIIAIYYLSKKIKVGFGYLAAAAGVFFITGYVFTAGVDWRAIFPLPLAAYFNKNTGSIFPLFPYAGYVLAGGLAGSLIAGSPGIFRKKVFPLYFIVAGAGSLALSLIIYYSEVFNPSSYWYAGPHLTFFRLSVVLLLNAAVSFAALKLNDVPLIIKQTGKRTLLIYVVHLMILYGSAWNLGFYHWMGHKLSFYNTLLMVILMVSAMLFMVWSIEKVKSRKKVRPGFSEAV